MSNSWGCFARQPRPDSLVDCRPSLTLDLCWSAGLQQLSRSRVRSQGRWSFFFKTQPGVLKTPGWFMAAHVHRTSVSGRVKLKKLEPKWACECGISNQEILWFTIFYGGKWKLKCVFSGIVLTCEPAFKAKIPHFLYIFTPYCTEGVVLWSRPMHEREIKGILAGRRLFS